jgi:hypothetical protein
MAVDCKLHAQHLHPLEWSRNHCVGGWFGHNVMFTLRLQKVWFVTPVSVFNFGVTATYCFTGSLQIWQVHIILIFTDSLTQRTWRNTKNIGWCEDPGWVNSCYYEVRCYTKQQSGLFRELRNSRFCLQWQLHELQQKDTHFLRNASSNKFNF